LTLHSQGCRVLLVRHTELEEHLMEIIRILAPFTRETALVGELARRVSPNSDTFRLLGDSEYIRKNTDGHVVLDAGEYEPAV
jgi:hypothetical protein